MFVVLSSVDILNIQLSSLSFVIYICGINISGIHINENLINNYYEMLLIFLIQLIELIYLVDYLNM